jgi:hypothetical protein
MLYEAVFLYYYANICTHFHKKDALSTKIFYQKIIKLLKVFEC